MPTLADALDLQRLGRVREAELLCESLLAREPDRPDALALLADIHLSGNRQAAALPALLSLARLCPQDAANLRRLGAALLALGRSADAVDALQLSLRLDPANARAENNLGQALLAAGRPDEAIQHLDRALVLQPRYAIAANNLGLALAAAGDLERARDALQRALAFDAMLLPAQLNLAAVQERRGDPTAALQCYAAALRLRPGDAATLAHQAGVLLSMDRAAEALQGAERALALNPDFMPALHVAGAALCRLHRPKDALRRLDRAIELDPSRSETWCARAVACQHLGDHDAAGDCLRRALALDPERLESRVELLAGLIPSVPASPQAARDARDAFLGMLTSLEDWLRGRELAPAAAWSLAMQPLFYLSYEPTSNKGLLQRFRSLGAAQLARVVPTPNPTLAPAPAPASDSSDTRLRIAVVSAQIFDHSVFNAITQGWLRHLDKRQIETTVVNLSLRTDATTAAARSWCDRFEESPRSLREWADWIRAARFDAVVFPEVGIDRRTLALASLRLADRQFAAWGHPETTGLPTVDGFLSGHAFEPPTAQAHYSERLLRLPRLGVYVEPGADMAGASPERFTDIPGAGPVFVCPGTPFKYRPQHDVVLTEVARRLGSCRFVFFRYERAALSELLHARLARAFREAGLDPERHLVFMPWLPRAEFAALLRAADVFLDTIEFSGFNTMLQAVRAHAPAVAFEGEFMRGRLASGVLRVLGMDEWVATDTAGYIDRAVQLASSASARAALRAQLRLAVGAAYRDLAAVRALELVLKGEDPPAAPLQGIVAT